MTDSSLAFDPETPFGHVAPAEAAEIIRSALVQDRPDIAIKLGSDPSYGGKYRANSLLATSAVRGEPHTLGMWLDPSSPLRHVIAAAKCMLGEFRRREREKDQQALSEAAQARMSAAVREVAAVRERLAAGLRDEILSCRYTLASTAEKYMSREIGCEEYLAKSTKYIAEVAEYEAGIAHLEGGVPDAVVAPILTALTNALAG